MSDTPVSTPAAEATSEQLLPPFVLVFKTETGCRVQSNLPDAFLVLALLMGGVKAAMEPGKPIIQSPHGNGFVSDMLHKMGRR